MADRVREKAEVHEIEIEKEGKTERGRDRAVTNGFFLPAGAVLCIPSLSLIRPVLIRGVFEGGGGEVTG